MAAVSLTAQLRDDLRVEMKTRNHEVFAGEPADAGGDNSAPKPTELLLSSLAGCKLITLQMYSERKGWNIRPISIDLAIEEVGEITKVKKVIHFPDHLTAEQKERLTTISGRCPVAKMLKNSIEYV